MAVQSLTHLPLVRASSLQERSQAATNRHHRLQYVHLRGRLVELSGSVPGTGAPLLPVAALIRQAQQSGAIPVWISRNPAIFFPPDFAQNGIDLRALPVVRTPTITTALRAAVTLLRYGDFGLLILDTDITHPLPRAAAEKLSRLARLSGTLVVILTPCPIGGGCLIPVSFFRAQITMQSIQDDLVSYEIRYTNRHRPTLTVTHQEQYHVTDSLC